MIKHSRKKTCWIFFGVSADLLHPVQICKPPEKTGKTSLFRKTWKCEGTSIRIYKSQWEVREKFINLNVRERNQVNSFMSFCILLCKLHTYFLDIAFRTGACFSYRDGSGLEQQMTLFSNVTDTVVHVLPCNSVFVFLSLDLRASFFGLFSVP